MHWNLGVDFPLILTTLVLVTGAILLISRFVLVKKETFRDKQDNWAVRFSKEYFPVLLLVLVIRSFIGQIYRVPTGSLEPTVMPGDMILVSQFAYGLHLPVIHNKIFNIGEPKIGDVAVFRWPANPNITYVKRIIGVPGTKISYQHKTLYINGKEAKQTFYKKGYDDERYGHEGMLPVTQFIENLNGVKHLININTSNRGINNEPQAFNLIVPKGYYFAMGDNRDNSSDSRMWGFVPEANLVGKAYWVVFSWNSYGHWLHKIRWHRFFKPLHL